jgi:sugar phosphate isomerase/epimerase
MMMSGHPDEVAPSGTGLPATGPTDVGWVLWSGTVGLESPVPARIEAALAGGFSRLSLSPLDVARSAEQGTSPVELGRRVRDSGLGIVMDPVMNWYPDPPPPRSRFGRFSAEDALQMCEALEVVAMTVIAQPTCSAPLEELADPFAAVCDRAAGFGAQVHLEFMPMSAVQDLATAWRIVAAADRPNGGLLFDTWHFFRGDPDFEVLARIPGDRIFGVQVDDADAEVRGTLREDTVNRLLPGDGTFDLVRAVRALDAVGGLTWVGPEVISPALEAMDPVDAACLAGQRVRDLLRRSRA